MTYHVRVKASASQRSLGTVDSYVVSDQPDNYENRSQGWPFAAEFPVSLRHDQETQKRRAYEYCNYLNKGVVVQPPIGEQQ